VFQALDMFLTAYDPNDLPGVSMDALGFDRGYTFLADSILPGMTNVASRPRYLSALCAGLYFADVNASDSPYRMREKRRESVLRFERLWALANVLASQRMEISTSGIRGITYVQSEIARLEENGASRASARYKLLSRQQQYGMFGMYGSVAEGMRFLERRTLSLTPDAGARLAEAFIEETALPKPIRNALQSAKNDIEVSIDVLTEWGERAHVEKTPKAEEASLIREALHRDPTRSRTVGLLTEFPWQGADGEDDETELRRIDRIARQLERRGTDPDLRAALRTIVAYEQSYRLSMLAFERILYLCRASVSGALRLDALLRDEVLEPIPNVLNLAVKTLADAIEEMRVARPTLRYARIEHTYQFLQRTREADDIIALVRSILSHHVDVQHGKFDHGRRKMPWVEETNNEISLTTTRVGGRNFEVTHQDQIRPHFYRLGSAEMFHRHGEV
jgi:hypothetical protein